MCQWNTGFPEPDSSKLYFSKLYLICLVEQLCEFGTWEKTGEVYYSIVAAYFDETNYSGSKHKYTWHLADGGGELGYKEYLWTLYPSPFLAGHKYGTGTKKVRK